MSKVTPHAGAVSRPHTTAAGAHHRPPGQPPASRPPKITGPAATGAGQAAAASAQLGSAVQDAGRASVVPPVSGQAAADIDAIITAGRQRGPFGIPLPPTGDAARRERVLRAELATLALSPTGRDVLHRAAGLHLKITIYPDAEYKARGYTGGASFIGKGQIVISESLAQKQTNGAAVIAHEVTHAIVASDGRLARFKAYARSHGLPSGAAGILNETAAAQVQAQVGTDLGIVTSAAGDTLTHIKSPADTFATIWNDPFYHDHYHLPAGPPPAGLLADVATLVNGPAVVRPPRKR